MHDQSVGEHRERVSYSRISLGLLIATLGAIALLDFGGILEVSGQLIGAVFLLGLGVFFVLCLFDCRKCCR